MPQQQQTTIIANTKSTTSSSYLINNSISNLRGWLIKEKSKGNRVENYYNHFVPSIIKNNTIISTSNDNNNYHPPNTNRRYFVVKYVKGGVFLSPASFNDNDNNNSNSDDNANYNSNELALCYYKNTPKIEKEDEMEPNGWIFLSDVTKIEEDYYTSTNNISDSIGSTSTNNYYHPQPQILQRQFILYHPSRILKLSCLDDVQYYTWINGLKRLCYNADIYKDGKKITSQYPVLPRPPLATNTSNNHRQRRSLSSSDYNQIEKHYHHHNIVDRDTMQAQLNFMRELKTNNNNSDNNASIITSDNDDFIDNDGYEIPNDSNENDNASIILSQDNNNTNNENNIDNDEYDECKNNDNFSDKEKIDDNEINVHKEEQYQIASYDYNVDNNHSNDDATFSSSASLFKPSNNNHKKSIIIKNNNNKIQQEQHTNNNANNNHQGQLETTNARLNRIIGCGKQQNDDDDSNENNVANSSSLKVDDDDDILKTFSNGEDYSMVETLNDDIVSNDANSINYPNSKIKLSDNKRDVIVSSLLLSYDNDHNALTTNATASNNHSSNDDNVNDCDDESTEIDLAKEKQLRSLLSSNVDDNVARPGLLTKTTTRTKNDNDDRGDNSQKLENNQKTNDTPATTIPTNIGKGISPDENFVTDDWDEDDDDVNDETSTTNNANDDSFLNNGMVQPDMNFLEDDWDE